MFHSLARGCGRYLPRQVDLNVNWFITGKSFIWAMQRDLRVVRFHLYPVEPWFTAQNHRTRD